MWPLDFIYCVTGPVGLRSRPQLQVNRGVANVFLFIARSRQPSRNRFLAAHAMDVKTLASVFHANIYMVAYYENCLDHVAHVSIGIQYILFGVWQSFGLERDGECACGCDTCDR